MVFNQYYVDVWYSSSEHCSAARSCILIERYCNSFIISGVSEDCIVIKLRVKQLSILYLSDRPILLASFAGDVCPIKDYPTNVIINLGF